MNFPGLKVSFEVGVRNNTFRHSPLVGGPIMEEYLLTILNRFDQKIKVVKHRLLLLLPVFIMEIIIELHEVLVQNLRHKILGDSFVC